MAGFVGWVSGLIVRAFSRRTSGEGSEDAESGNSSNWQAGGLPHGDGDLKNPCRKRLLFRGLRHPWISTYRSAPASGDQSWAARVNIAVGSLAKEGSTDGCAPSAVLPSRTALWRTDTRPLVSLPSSARAWARWTGGCRKDAVRHRRGFGGQAAARGAASPDPPRVGCYEMGWQTPRASLATQKAFTD